MTIQGCGAERGFGGSGAGLFGQCQMNGGIGKTKKRRNQRRRAAAVWKAGSSTAATAIHRRSPPSLTPLSRPSEPLAGPTQHPAKACPGKRVRVDSPIKQPATHRVSAAV